MMPRRRQPDLSVERINFDEFLASRLRWRQGEHVSLIGPTGTGKTTLGAELLDHRASQSPKFHATIVCTKPKDDVMRRITRKGTPWDVVRDWPPAWDQRRTVFWPSWRGPRDNVRQARAIRTMMTEAFSTGNLAIMVDELAYLTRKLSLEGVLKDYWQQGRSVGLSLVGCVQRPAWVPLDLYSQATHLFWWRTTDETDLKRIQGCGGLSSASIRDAVSRLDGHDVLYVNTRTGDSCVTTAQRRITR